MCEWSERVTQGKVDIIVVGAQMSGEQGAIYFHARVYTNVDMREEVRRKYIHQHLLSRV